MFARIFFEFFKLSLFVIGGGYAIIAVADSSLARKGWIKEGELAEQLPLFQMLPGLIAVHAAVYTGRKLAGAAGAAIAVLAVILPSVLVFSAVAAGYGSLPLENPAVVSAFAGSRAALAGIIAAAVCRSWRNSGKDVFFCSTAVLSMFALFCGVSVPLVLLAAAAAGVVSRLVAEGGGRKYYASSILPLLLFLKYGSLCFGGGFVLVPMYIEDFVGPSAPFLNISECEFSDLMALTQMTPGPIGINGATFFGFRLAGFVGAVAASVLMVLPGSLAIYWALHSIERFENSRIVAGILRGAKPASFALMAVALVSIAGMSVFGGAGGGFNFKAAGLVLASSAAMMTGKVNAVPLIGVCALVAILLRA